MKPVCATDMNSMKRFVIGYTLLLLIIKVFADFGQLDFVFNGLDGLFNGLDIFPASDKLLHFLLAGSFALVLNLAFYSRARQIGPPSELIIAIVPGTLLAALGTTCDELSNLLIVSRGWSPADLLANCLGIFCLGVLPMVVVVFAFRKRSLTGAIISAATRQELKVKQHSVAPR